MEALVTIHVHLMANLPRFVTRLKKKTTVTDYQTLMYYARCYRLPVDGILSEAT